MPRKKAFADMTVAELHEAASKKDISGRSDMNKEELIAALEAGDGGTTTEAEAGAEESPLKVVAPATVPCHSDFTIAWECEGVTELIVSGKGKVSENPLRFHAAEQGTLTIGLSGTTRDGETVGATVKVEVVHPDKAK